MKEANKVFLYEKAISDISFLFLSIWISVFEKRERTAFEAFLSDFGSSIKTTF